MERVNSDPESETDPNLSNLYPFPNDIFDYIDPNLEHRAQIDLMAHLVCKRCLKRGNCKWCSKGRHGPGVDGHYHHADPYH